MEYSFIGTIIVLSFIAFMIGKDVRRWQDFGIVEDYKERGKLALLKPMYIGVGLIIFIPLVILFFSLLDDIADIPTNKTITPSEVRNLAIAFVGTITGIGALFAGYLAILRTEENARQSHAAESRSKAAHDQNEITRKQNDLNERQNDLIEQQNKIATKQNKLATEGRKTTERQADVAEKQVKIAEKQADTAEKGFLDGRFNNAIEGLGKNNEKGEPILEIRIAALYILESIAQKNISDHIRIMETLCAYIQQNSPRDIEKETHNDSKPLRTDIQIALNIIGRRDGWPENKKRMKIELDQKYYITLWDCNLHGARIDNGNFNKARFNRSNISNAIFSNIKLIDARFPRTNLSKTTFAYTNMNDAKVRQANLTDAKIHDVIMRNANMKYSYAYTADFLRCTNFTQEQLDEMFLGVDVKLPKDTKLQKDLIHPQKGTKYYKKYNTFDDFMEAYHEWLEDTGY